MAKRTTHSRKRTSVSSSFTPQVTVLSSQEHPITEKSFPLEVQWILNRLRTRGYLAFVVGGGVRDLLLEKEPKDFDLATNATPKELQAMFFNSRLIGRRFRIAHIYFREGDFVEISTFRAQPVEEQSGKGPIRDDNRFGTPAEDAWRRDLTINGLFYDSAQETILDYVGGLKDLRRRTVRTIGDPLQRFREDPVRMFRAIRHAARHHCTMEPQTWNAIARRAKEIKLCPPARLQAEFAKEVESGHFARSFRKMYSSKLLQGWMPTFASFLGRKSVDRKPYNGAASTLISADWGSAQAVWDRLHVIDAKICNGQTFSEAVLYTLLFLPIGWDYVIQHARPGCSVGRLWQEALEGPLKACFQELPLHRFSIESIRRIVHTYWRLHWVKDKPQFERSLQSSPFLPEVIQLMQVELQAHLCPFPSWLEPWFACEEQ